MMATCFRMTLIMMKSKVLSLYLQGKLSTDEIRRKIHKSLKSMIEKNQSCVLNHDLDKPKIRVSSVQLMNLLNEYINGTISKYEFFYLLTQIHQNQDIQVDNPAAIELLFQIVTSKNKYPIGIAYIKSMIYRP